MKKQYTTPEMELFVIECENVLAESGIIRDFKDGNDADVAGNWDW